MVSLVFALMAVKRDVVPLWRAHAHNDYRHARPLHEALEQGFASVEADIFLVDGELRVGHDRAELRQGRTLESLYLDPLLARVKANRGSVYRQKGELLLLVDIKSDGPGVYAALRPRLERYREMLTRFEDGKVVPGAVTVVLSGSRPIDVLAAETRRLAFLDGRPDDLNREDRPRTLMPLVSDSYFNHAKWLGMGQMPAEERSRIDALVRSAHAKGMRMRFWAHPDRESVWALMVDAGVDLVNTDRLADLAVYLRQRK